MLFRSARWQKEKGDANTLQAQSESNATHNPLPNTQDTVPNKGTNVPLSTDKLPTCPQKEILALYAKHLPQLAQPRLWEGNRATILKQRWAQAAKPSPYSPDGYTTKEAGLKWWDGFFEYLANDTKLAQGFETQGRTWKPDLEWICTASNFAKIIDGKYDK
mgnify:FL=1